ncbi:hypothetical protein BDZ94DRAFT_1314414 [Collybia nuda]|uniref:DUF6534 domain-containing protein n=1 Tax=Collybia nuda TaxID=64659 RepID=A0A9P5XWX6_9AGAR|nr:hypothetical protein BDZ94DRAFT_1314414 [Collybia nuda]
MATEGFPFNLLSGDDLGALLIGLCISLVLCGVVIIQGYTYYQRFGDDRLFLKVLATAILVLELLHSCLIIQIVYRFAVVLGGHTETGPNSYILTASVVPEVLVTALVQGFFAFRIYRLSGSPYISVICWAMILFRLGGGLALMVEGTIDVPRVPNYVTFTEECAWLIDMGFIMSAVADVLIAASLCFYLKRMTPGEQLKSTSELVDRLMIWIIQTGTVTSIASVAVVVAFFARPQSEIWFATYMVTAKLYSNSFFTSLNVRRHFRTGHVVPLTAIVENGLEFRGGDPRLQLNISKAPSTQDSSHYSNEMTPVASEAPGLTVPEKSFGPVLARQDFMSVDLERQQSKNST